MGKIEIHQSCQIPGIDEIFDKYIPDVGTFAEVGAFDGMTYGCTWGLAKAGWHGVYVEPFPEFADECVKNHSGHNVKVYNMACGSFNGETELTVYGEVSTTILDKWARQWGMNESTPKINVQQKTIDSILQDAGIESLDLLVVDVEGAEIEVLKGFTLAKYCPKMAIIELHETQGTGPDEKGFQTPWVDKFFSGYTKIYADAINTIYVLTK